MPAIDLLSTKPGQQAAETKLHARSAQASQNRVLFGWQAWIPIIRIRLHIFLLALQQYHSLFTATSVLRTLFWYRLQIFGKRKHEKVVQYEHRFYRQVYAPGFPSELFDRFVISEFNRIQPVKAKTNRLNTIFFAITKKCPLRCEHCFEWNELNKQETLTYNDLEQITEKLLQVGTSKIVFSGGEPTVRFEDLLQLNRFIDGRAECWVYTSGYHLHREKIRKLKEAGVTGLLVSVDHYDGEAHNQFRRNPESFAWAEKCLLAARAEGMITAMSICLRRDFVSDVQLDRYLQLAYQWGASFVQLLEPKATGHYANMDVLLHEHDKKILDQYYLDRNGNSCFAHMPVIEYHGYHERKAGCQAAGRRSMYVNTNGELQACPFCQTTAGKVVDDHLEERIETLKKSCHAVGLNYTITKKAGRPAMAYENAQ